MTRCLFRRSLWVTALTMFLGAGGVFAQQADEREAKRIFKELVQVAGVSFHEELVLAKVKELLPNGVSPVIDDMNNLVVVLGKGDPEILFVAHMDEIGLEITGINEDGTLRVRGRGGFFSTIWESKVVEIHTKSDVVGGIIVPRQSYREQNPAAHTRDDLAIYVGTDSKSQTEALGIEQGDFVVQTKRVISMGTHRMAAGSTDDRGGCTAQILALKRLLGKKLDRTVAFAWVVQEETGLSGARHLSQKYSPEFVAAIDTFVSSDAPRDPQNIGYTPMGKGAILRVYDSASIAPPQVVEKVRRIAEDRNIPVQWGITSGGTDGSVFVGGGSHVLPLSWPGIYSHSYVSVIDVRDLLALTDLMVAIAESY